MAETMLYLNVNDICQIPQAQCSTMFNKVFYREQGRKWDMLDNVWAPGDDESRKYIPVTKPSKERLKSGKVDCMIPYTTLVYIKRNYIYF